MKTTIHYIILFVCASLLTTGLSAQPTPKWAKKSAKSLVEVVTRDEGGLVLQRRTGFIAEGGLVVTTYDQLPAAKSVEVVVDGKSYPALRTVAADAMMDFCVFTADIKKATPLPTAATKGTMGQQVFVLAPSLCQADTICTIETVKEQPYYALSHSETLGAPLMNADGAVLGMVHSTDKNGAYAVAMSTLMNVKPTGMNMVGRTYADLPIPVLLPQEEEQARTFIFLSGRADSARYMTHVDDYIAAFPTQAFGYTSRGERLVAGGNLTAAEETYNRGLAQVATPDELLFSHSQALYRHAIAVADTTLLPTALSLCEKALSANSLPLYRNHRATILYSLRRYAEAATDFEAVAQTNMRSPQTFVYASQSRRMAGDSIGVVLALLDSAMACYPTPLPAEAANTVLLRATTRVEAALWRAAVQDYNDYEHLCGGRVNAEFHYRRFIAEVNGRMYQQALDDLDRAIALAPDDAELHTQKALFLHRLGQEEEAKAEAQRAIALDPGWAEELQSIIK